MSSRPLLALRLRCDASAPHRARQAVAGIPAIDSVRDDALLVVSELASNAVLHSGSSDGDEFELRAEMVEGALRLEVVDRGGSTTEPHRPERDPLEPGGMGLAVVESLSRCWGSERCDRVRVWAELPLPQRCSGRRHRRARSG